MTGPISIIAKNPDEQRYADCLAEITNHRMKGAMEKAMQLILLPVKYGCHCPKYNPFLDPDKFERHIKWQRFFMDKGYYNRSRQ